MVECPNIHCKSEMEQIPSVIKVGKVEIGNPDVKIYLCPKCKRIRAIENNTI